MAFAKHPHHLDYSSITSICKNILPFPFTKRKGLPPSDPDFHLAKLQSDNLKWQQESFHHIHRLMGLHNEGILSESQVSSFRSHLIDTLITSTPPLHQDHTPILRDKLLFLKELYLAKCISVDEYHRSKRPLLQSLSLLGAEIQASDVIVGNNPKIENSAEEEWSEIELHDENVMLEDISSKKSKHRSALKQIKGAASSVLNRVATSKRQWGFKKSKRSNISEEDDQRASVENEEKAFVGSCVLVSAPVGGGPDTQKMKRKLHPDGTSSDFFIDKVLGERVRKQLARIQLEHNNTTSSSIQLTNEDIEAVSTRLPIDMAELKRLFSKPWCEKYGNVVLDVVRKEFKEHMAELSRVKKGRRETVHT